MKVFVATKEGQGLRRSDFSHAEEGELVIFSAECATDRFDIEGGCGCRRSMTGLNTGQNTTTFKVSNMDLTKDEFLAKHMAAKVTWGIYGNLEEAEADGLLPTDVEILLEAAIAFPEGVVLERRGQDVQSRPQFSWTHPPEEEF